MSEPLVSIIIRTCGRPAVLKNALESVRQQRYSNIEIIVVEDGANLSESFIRENFPGQKLRYQSTGTHEGRCKTGNLGLSLAAGKYLNFLDDDDILLPNHVEVLVERLENTDYHLAYAIAEERQIETIDLNNAAFRIRRKLIRYKQPFNKLLLCYMNYIPIQSIMFSRSLYEEYGGFDENLDILEDWDLWLRYSLSEEFLFVPEITSVYYTPYKGNGKRKRVQKLKEAEKAVIHNHQSYLMTMDAAYINKEMDYILNIYNKKGLLFYMQKIRNFLLYRDI